MFNAAKARLVVQGFKDPDALAGKLGNNAPTLTALGKHLVLLITALSGWGLFTADVATTFLSGNPSDRGAAVSLPSDALQFI